MTVPDWINFQLCLGQLQNIAAIVCTTIKETLKRKKRVKRVWNSWKSTRHRQIKLQRLEISEKIKVYCDKIIKKMITHGIIQFVHRCMWMVELGTLRRASQSSGWQSQWLETTEGKEFAFTVLATRGSEIVTRQSCFSVGCVDWCEVFCGDSEVPT